MNNFYEALKYEEQCQPQANKFYNEELLLVNIKRCRWSSEAGKRNQRDDIDFIAKTGMGEQIKVSEKFRSKDYGDMMIEILSRWNEIEENEPGWALKSKADVIFYHTPDKLYIVDVASLQNFISNFRFDQIISELDASTIWYLKEGNTVETKTLPFRHTVRTIPTYIMGELMWRNFCVNISWRVLEEHGVKIKMYNKSKEYQY